MARRAHLPTRRRRRATKEEVARAHNILRVARGALRLAIRNAKSQAWKALLTIIDANPWGQPYKLVLRKLRSWTLLVTEVLDPQLLTKVVNTSFP